MSLLLLFNQPLPWHKVLLETAKRLQSEKHNEVAAVASMMACETASERAFTHFFEARGLTEFREPIEGFFASYSLANDRVRKFYSALSGDSINESPFWARFKRACGFGMRWCTMVLEQPLMRRLQQSPFQRNLSSTSVR